MNPELFKEIKDLDLKWDLIFEIIDGMETIREAESLLTELAQFFYAQIAKATKKYPEIIAEYDDGATDDDDVRDCIGRDLYNQYREEKK